MKRMGKIPNDACEGQSQRLIPLASTSNNITNSASEGQTLLPMASLSSASYNNKRPKANVLVVGQGNVSPMQYMGANLSKDLKLKLEQFENITQLNMLQQSVWPNMTFGSNCIIIGGKNNKKGKTLSYLLPLIQRIIDLKDQLSTEVETQDKQGPGALIITGSYKSAEKILTKVTNLTCGSGIISHLVNGIEGYGKLREILGERNPEIIVTTLNNVLNMFDKYYDVFRFDRLRYLVFDDCQLVFKNELDATQSLMEAVMNYTQCQTPPIQFQTIFCGNAWDEYIASAATCLIKDPAVHIANPEAALIYGGVQVTVHHVAKKLNAIADIVACGDTAGRYVIVCQKSSDVTLMAKHLRDGNMVCIEMNDGTNFGQLSKLKQWNLWEEGKRILITTHEILKACHTMAAPTHLLHFDVPFTTPEEFWARHNCMWENFPSFSDFIDRNLHPDDSKPVITTLQAHVFICDQDNYMRTVLKFVDLGFSVPKTLADRVTEARLAEWKMYSLCDSLLNFGKCYDLDECKNKRRHFFNEDEIAEEPIVPRIGRIELELLNVVEVNRFIGKVIRTYEFEGKKTTNHVSYAAKRQKLQSDLDAYYEKEDNRVKLKSVLVDTMCAIRDREGKFIRGIVKEIYQTDKSSFRVVKMRTFAIDYGSYSMMQLDELYELPEFLRLPRPSVVEIIVANLKPRYGQPQFSRYGYFSAENWLGKNLTGDVALSIGSKVWVSNLREYSKSSEGDWYEEGNMRVEFTTVKKCAAPNPTHLTNLYELAKNKGMNCDAYDAQQAKDLAEDALAESTEPDKQTPDNLSLGEAEQLKKFNEQYDKYQKELEAFEDENHLFDEDLDEEDVDPDAQLDLWMPGDEDDAENVARIFDIGLNELLNGIEQLKMSGQNIPK